MLEEHDKCTCTVVVLTDTQAMLEGKKRYKSYTLRHIVSQIMYHFFEIHKKDANFKITCTIYLLLN